MTQKAVFRDVKGGLLHSKRPPFGNRKIAFRESILRKALHVKTLIKIPKFCKFRGKRRFFHEN